MGGGGGSGIVLGIADVGALHALLLPFRVLAFSPLDGGFCLSVFLVLLFKCCPLCHFQKWSLYAFCLMFSCVPIWSVSVSRFVCSLLGFICCYCYCIYSGLVFRCSFCFCVYWIRLPILVCQVFLVLVLYTSVSFYV